MAITQTFYVDPAVADGGDGSFATPYNNHQSAITAATSAEAVIKLKRGHVYGGIGSNSGALHISAKAPAGFLRIEPYGDAEMPPTFFAGAAMLPGDTGWSHVGSGLWKKAMSDNAGYVKVPPMRLYVGGAKITGTATNKSLGTGYSLGIARPRYVLADASTEAQVLAEVGTMGYTGPRMWTFTTGAAGGNGILYVWTGSASVDPPTFYDGLVLVGKNNLYDASGFGRVYGLLSYNCSRLIVDGLDVLWAPSGITVSGNSTSADVQFRNMRILAYGGGGLLLEGTAGCTVTRAVLADSTIDACATQDEDWAADRSKFGIQGIHAAQDPCIIGRWTNGCRVERSVSKDGYHGNFFVGAMASTGSGTTADAQVIDCVAHNPNRRYGTACGASGLGAGNIARFTRFKAYDVVGFFNNTGSGQTIFSDCVFRDSKKPYDGYDATNSGSEVCTIPAFGLTPMPSWGDVEAGCVTMRRCTLYQPYGFAIDINKYGGAGTIPAGAFVFEDSVIVDTRWINDTNARRYSTTYFKGGISIAVQATLPAGTLVATNSYIYTGGAGNSIVSTANASTTTLAGWAGLSGTPSEADPKVDSYGRPIAASPLIAQAATNGLTRDAAGVYRDVMSAIGAYEYVTQRPTRTL